MELLQATLQRTNEKQEIKIDSNLLLMELFLPERLAVVEADGKKTIAIDATAQVSARAHGMSRVIVPNKHPWSDLRVSVHGKE